MKILTLIPVFKRPEVLKICLDGLKSFAKSVTWDFEAVFVLSPDDPDFKTNQKMVKKYGYKAVYFPNLPVANKMNAGIFWAVKNLKFDYLMNLGSDDLVHLEIETLYRPYFEKNHRFFGINSLYFYELKTQKTMFFHTYNTNGSIGAGRMIHYSILKSFYDQAYPIYEPGVNAGLDGSSAMSIKRVMNEIDVIIDSGTFPYVVDIKTNTNINHMIHLETRKQNIVYCNSDFLQKFYSVI